MTEKQLRWALQLRGPQFDIDDAIALFGESSDLTVRNVGSDAAPLFVLTSPQLDGLGDSLEAEKLATKLLAIVNGILFVLQPDRVPLASTGIQERAANGRWIHHLVAVGLSVGRSRARADSMVLVGGKPSPQHTRPAPALRWAAEAEKDEVVSHALRYLSGEPDWFDYYNAFELMRDDINRRIGGQHRQEQMGWPNKKDLDHFTLSAQVYRHPPPWDGGYTPDNAMTLAKATHFIQSLAQTWLAWRFP